MHVRIIHQYFRLPEEGGGLRTWYMGKYLLDHGYEVSIITAGNISGYKRRNVDGLDVHYLPVYYSNHLGFLSRIHAFWLFVWKTVRLSAKLPRPDVHYILTTPLTTGIIGSWLKQRYNVPYIFEVGDLWPEAPHQLGVLRQKWLLNLARRLENKSYENAASLVGLSPEISSFLEDKNPGKRVHTIPNVSDTGFFQPAPASSEMENFLDSKNSFVISYIGTLGQANHLEYLIEAVARKPDNLDVRVIIMGDGAQASKLKELAKPYPSIRFLNHGNRDAVRDLLRATDAVYISFKDVPVLTSGSPNKFFDGLAAGKMIIINFDGWIRKLIEKHSCGFWHSPNHPEQLWEKLIPFTRNNKMLSEFQRNARQLGEESFRPDIVFSKLPDVLSPFSPGDSVH